MQQQNTRAGDIQSQSSQSTETHTHQRAQTSTKLMTDIEQCHGPQVLALAAGTLGLETKYFLRLTSCRLGLRGTRQTGKEQN